MGAYVWGTYGIGQGRFFDGDACDFQGLVPSMSCYSGSWLMSALFALVFFSLVFGYVLYSVLRSWLNKGLYIATLLSSSFSFFLLNT